MKNHTIKSIMLVVAIAILIFNISILFIGLNRVDLINLNKFTAKGTFAYTYGTINFCLNPVIEMNSIVFQCGDNLSMHTNDVFNCTLNYTQLDSDNVTFKSYFITNTTVFEITLNGTINFTANKSTFNNHSSIILVNETGNLCENQQISSYLYNFTVNFINTPPEYYRTLPNITMDRLSTTYPFSLNDYFRDIDGDALTYTAMGYNIGALTITIDDNTSEVSITSENSCDEQRITFMAEDIHEEYNTSVPPVIVTMNCPTPEVPEEVGDDSSGGGSGSRGGGTSTTCVEEWKCLKWSDCKEPNKYNPDYPTGYKERYCYDNNGCDEDDFEKTLYQECNYIYPGGCYPEWECTSWTPCRRNGTKERSCIDRNDCPTEDQIRFGMIETMMFCTYTETCVDGIKNNNELGIDCGGECEPCTTIQLPSTINTNNRVLTWVLSILLFIILLLAILYMIFKKEIKRILSKIIWSLVKKAARQIYLGGESKKRVFNYLKSYENYLNKKINTKLDKDDYNKLESKLYILFRRVFSEMLDMSIESSKTDFINKINSMDTTEEFKKVLISLLNRFLELEIKGRKIITSELDEIIMDFNTIKFFTFNISDNFDKNEFINISIETTDNKLSQILKNINESYIHLQSNNYNNAKSNYMKLIELYESLEEEDKAKIYDLSTLLFNILTYVSSHIDNK